MSDFWAPTMSLDVRPFCVIDIDGIGCVLGTTRNGNVEVSHSL